MNIHHMSLEKKILLLDLPLLDETDIGSMIYRLYEGRIFHAIVKEGEKVTMEMTIKGYEFLDKHGSGRFFNIYEFKSFADVEPDVRNWAAKGTEQPYTFVDAIVIANSAQKILADFYVRFNKPKNPTKVFRNSKQALDWINKIKSSF